MGRAGGGGAGGRVTWGVAGLTGSSRSHLSGGAEVGESSESESEGEVLQLFRAMERRRRSSQDPAEAGSSSSSAYGFAGTGTGTGTSTGVGAGAGAGVLLGVKGGAGEGVLKFARSKSVAMGALPLPGGLLRSESARIHRRTTTYDISSFASPVPHVPRHHGPVSLTGSRTRILSSPPVEPRAAAGQAMGQHGKVPRQTEGRVHERSASFHERPTLRGFPAEAK